MQKPYFSYASSEDFIVQAIGNIFNRLVGRLHFMIFLKFIFGICMLLVTELADFFATLFLY